MRYTIFYTAISILVVSIITMTAVFFTTDISVPDTVHATGKNEQNIQETIEDYQYIIKSYEDKLSVYKRGSKKPMEVFSVYLKTLPEYDQKELSKGVYVRNFKELVSLIEDYTS